MDIVSHQFGFQGAVEFRVLKYLKSLNEQMLDFQQVLSSSLTLLR